MAKNNKLSGLIDDTNLDKWLCSTGYLFSKNEEELDHFERLYEDFDYKLKNTVIDYDAITEGNIHFKSKIVDLFPIGNKEIEELRFAARKGDESITDRILLKMKSKHQNKNGDK